MLIQQTEQLKVLMTGLEQFFFYYYYFMPEIFGAWVSVSISGTKRKRVFMADPKMTVWISKNVFQWKESVNLLRRWVLKQLIDQRQQVEPGQMALICAFVNTLTTRRQLFQWIKKIHMRFCVQSFRVPAYKPESQRGSSMVYFKSLGYIFCLELLIENYECHF